MDHGAREAVECIDYGGKCYGWLLRLIILGFSTPSIHTSPHLYLIISGGEVDSSWYFDVERK